MITSKVLGNTEEGRAWVLKALHPSEDVSGVRGIPDRCSGGSVHLEYTQRVAIPSPGVAWDCDLSLSAHPLCPLSIIRREVVSGTTDYFSHYNTQITGATVSPQNMLASWLAIAQEWRVTNASMTIELDASALYNNGSVVGANAPTKERHMTTGLGSRFSAYVAATSGGVVTTNVPLSANNSDDSINYPLFSYAESDKPAYSTLINIPGAYQGMAKDGIYMPLPIDEVEQVWMSEKDLCYFAGTGAPTIGDNWPVRDTFALGTPGSQRGILVESTVMNAGTNWVSSSGAIYIGSPWPYAQNAGVLFSGTGTYPAVKPAYNIVGVNGGNRAGDLWFPPCNTTFSHASFKNMSLQAGLVVTMRMGYEIRVQPGTLLSTQVMPSPSYDPLAIDAYYQVRRQMAHGYPASYNSLNKLLKVIIMGAQAALPALGAVFPALSPFVGPGGALLSGLNGLREARERSKNAKAGRLQIEAMKSFK